MVALASYGKDNIFDQEFDGLGGFTSQNDLSGSSQIVVLL